MNIKNMICAILIMGAAFGNSVAVAVSPRFVALRVGLVGVGVGAGVGGTLGYQQGKEDSLGKQSLKTLVGGAAGTAVGAVVGLAGIALAVVLNKVCPKKS